MVDGAQVEDGVHEKMGRYGLVAPPFAVLQDVAFDRDEIVYRVLHFDARRLLGASDKFYFGFEMGTGGVVLTSAPRVRRCAGKQADVQCVCACTQENTWP